MNIYPAGKLPFLPLVIIYNIIVLWRYVHACSHAPNGFWGCGEADVDDRFRRTESRLFPLGDSTDEIAAFMMVSEYPGAMKWSGAGEGVANGCAWS